MGLVAYDWASWGSETQAARKRSVVEDFHDRFGALLSGADNVPVWVAKLMTIRAFCSRQKKLQNEKRMHYFLRVCAIGARYVGRGVTGRRKGCFQRSSSVAGGLKSVCN